MSDFLANYAGLETAAADIKSGSTGIENGLSDLDGRLKPLAANWEGDASLAYQRAKADWTSAMQDMNLILDKISQLVIQASASYRSTDQTNARLFGG